ncbi:hypothetical protein [Muribacter muris]|uniref:hypothetical protein n=1 Tax=Muribacter muris TaxID=67855 RepID=UPI000AC2AEA3|nr:hypothetical protein [Muribacter muris]
MLLTSTELAEFIAEIEKANLLEIEKGDLKEALSVYLIIILIWELCRSQKMGFRRFKK